MATTIATLSSAESKSLIRCEAVIKKNLEHFVAVGNALAEIRDSQLYRVEFATFTAYCRTKWNLSKSHAYRYIQAAEVQASVSPIGDIRNEAQARELAKLRAEDRPEALAEAKELYGDDVTAAEIRGVVEHWTGDEDEDDYVEVEEDDIDDAIDVSPDRPLFGIALRRALNNCQYAKALNDTQLALALEVCCCVLKTLQLYPTVTLDIATCQLSAFVADVADGQFDREAK